MNNPVPMPDLSHSTKNRIAAVDIMRILAALAVMYEHLYFSLDSPLIEELRSIPVEIFGHMSGIFFVLAGFFACRRISWRKAINNAWWCFAPFVLWNLIFIAVAWYNGNSCVIGHSLADLFGVTRILLPGLTLGDALPSHPANTPLWFMRDLTLLFLLSPLLCRAAKYLVPLAVMMSLLPVFEPYFRPDFEVFCAPYAITLFCFGCYLGSFGKEARARMLSFSSLSLILLYLVVTAVGIYIGSEYLPPEAADLKSKPLIVSLISFCIFYQLARYLELRLPALARFALLFAPVTFLTFATHEIIYWFGVPDLLEQSEVFLLCLPLILFSLLALLFVGLRNLCAPHAWGRYLLHLVAHYKVRPDDLGMLPRPSEAPGDGLPVGAACRSRSSAD